MDDFIVDMPPNQIARDHRQPPARTSQGVQVEWISRYPEGGGLQSDLEALERMTADPAHAAETLVSLCPVVFRSHWATLLQIEADGARAVVLDHPRARPVRRGRGAVRTVRRHPSR